MDYCNHPRTEVRYRYIAGGARVIQNQCIDCGNSVGNFIGQKDKSDAYLQALQPWDDTLKEKELSKIEERRVERALEAQKRSSEWWAWYNAYLQTPEWKTRRRRVLERDNHLCQGCRMADATQVHHLTYAHVGNELLYELISVCDDCHTKEHEPNTRGGPPPA